jgi:hydrogenase maturation protease
VEGLSSAFAGLMTARTAFLGIGNTDRGDDGLGVRLAEDLREAGVENVFVAGTTPENYVTVLGSADYDTVVFLDALRWGGQPGSVILMDATEIKSAFPQASTHKISLGTLAASIRSWSGGKVWLLGVCPVSVRTGEELSGPVKETLRSLKQLITAARKDEATMTERKRVCI